MSDDTTLKIIVQEQATQSGGPGGIPGQPVQFPSGQGAPNRIGPEGPNASGPGGLQDVLDSLTGDDAKQQARNEKLADAIAKAVRAAQKEALKQQKEEAAQQKEVFSALRHLLVQLPGGSTLLQLADRFNGLNYAAKTVFEHFSKLGTVDVLGWLKNAGATLRDLLPKFQGNTERRSVRGEYSPPEPVGPSGKGGDIIDAEFTVRKGLESSMPTGKAKPDEDIIDVDTEPARPIRGYLPGPTGKAGGDDAAAPPKPDGQSVDSGDGIASGAKRGGPGTGIIPTGKGIIPTGKGLAKAGGADLSVAGKAAQALTQFVPAAGEAVAGVTALAGAFGVGAGTVVAGAVALKLAYNKLLSDANRTSQELGKYGQIATGNAIRDIRQQVYDMQRERRVSAPVNSFLDANQKLDQGLQRLADAIRGPLMERIAPAVERIAAVVEFVAPLVEGGVKVAFDNAGVFAQILAVVSGLPGAAFLVPGLKAVIDNLGTIVDNTLPKKKGFDVKTIFDLQNAEPLERGRTQDVARRPGPVDTDVGFSF